jgi:hypothetical protein
MLVTFLLLLDLFSGNLLPVDARLDDDELELGSASGLPDFSPHNVPKWGKIYLIVTELPNGLKMY